MNTLSPARWVRLCQALVARPDFATTIAPAWHDRLQRAYSEPHRCYHTTRHIAECLDLLDSARHLARQIDAVECAIWFHDAVYDPRASDNEERSAALAAGYLHEIGSTPALAETVRGLVLATKQHRSDGSSDASLLIDIDLSILGQPPARFAEYDSQIRQEYAWVAPEIFAAKRAAVLKNFLDRERIFTTDFFARQFEPQARFNLAKSLKNLR